MIQKTLYKDKENIKIKITSNTVEVNTELGEDVSEKKIEFNNTKLAFKYYKTFIKNKVKNGFSLVDPNRFKDDEHNDDEHTIVKEKNNTVSDSSDSTSDDTKDTLVEKKPKKNIEESKEPKSEENDDQVLPQVIEEFEVPFGYVEISKKISDKLDIMISHLAEFMKQAKRTKAIFNIRGMTKKYQCYKPIQYKINVALDQFEDKGLDIAKWALKKSNRILNLSIPSNDGCVIIKTSNLRILFDATKDMLLVLNGLIKYYDKRSHEEVQLTKRKQEGKILLRPTKKPVIQFFREGIELKNNSLKLVSKFKDKYPEIAYKVIR